MAPADKKDGRGGLLSRAFARFHGARSFHVACRIAGAGILLLLAMIAWLWIVGVPSRVTKKIFRELESGGLEISSDRIWLDPIEGLKARNFRVRVRDEKLSGPVTAREVFLDVNWLNIIAGGPWFDALTLRGGSAVLFLPPEFGTNGLPCEFAVSNVTARIANAWEMFRLENFSAQCGGLQMDCRGVLVLPENAAASTNGTTAKGAKAAHASPLENLMKVRTSLQDAPQWTRELYRHIAEIQTHEPVSLRVVFSGHGGAPELGHVQFNAEGGSALCHGLRVDGWNIDADIAQGVMRAPRIELRARGRLCRLDGTINFTNGIAELHAVNELPPSYWRDLLPRAWIAELARTPLEFHGALRTEIWLPPATFDAFGDRWRGAMTWHDAQYRGIGFSDGRMEISRDGPKFLVTNVSAVASRAQMSGPFSGSVEIDLPTGEVAGRIVASLDPHIFSPWIPHDTREFIELFRFPFGAPSFDGQFRAGGESNDLLMISGMVRGSNTVFRDVTLAAMEASLNYSNDFLTLAPFSVARTNGAASGRLDLDLQRGIYSFDLESTTDPLSIGQLVSSNLFQSLQIGRFEGPTRLHATGVWNDRNAAQTDVKVDVDADRIGLKWFIADHATCTVRTRGLQYEATNIVAQAYGGNLAARFFLYVPANGGNSERYELDLDAQSNELKSVALAMHPEMKDPPSGTMRLKLQIAGLIDDPDLHTVKGEGSVKISDGALHKIKLFGGISSLLSKLSPDLGYAEQTGLKMSFDIRDGKLSTGDLELNGFWMSVKAKGTYGISDDKLDLLAEAQMLKHGTAVGDAVRFLTTPVTKLFKIQLNGTLADPEWKTANLPKIF